MRSWHTKFSHTAWLLACSCAANADPTVLQAITDFTNIDSGEVPYYVEVVGGRNALAINAAKEEYREKFARAEAEFTGPDGMYNITINALGEIDGDGVYRLIIDDVIYGEVVNTPVDVDYTVVEHTFQGIPLSPPVTIAIESMAVSNDLIPEGEGYAFARGRWRSVSLIIPTEEDTAINSSVDIAVSIPPSDAPITQDESMSVIALVNNASTTIATGVVVEFSMPEGLSFINSPTCTIADTVVTCEVPELEPGALNSVSFNAFVEEVDTFIIEASLLSDQADSNAANNSANLVVESRAPMSIIPEITTITESSSSGSGLSGSTDSNSSTDSEESSTVTSAGSGFGSVAQTNNETNASGTNQASTTQTDTGISDVQNETTSGGGLASGGGEPNTSGAMSIQSALVLSLFGLLLVRRRA